MSSGEDEAAAAVAPEYVMAEANHKKKRRGGKKRPRPDDEKEGAQAEESKPKPEPSNHSDGDDGEGDDGAEEEEAGAAGEAGERKRKRRRQRGKKKKGSGDAEGEEEGEDGGDTTTTGAAGDDEASDYPGAASASASGASAPAPAQADKTIYVEGISYQATEEDLTRFFQDKGCGKVVAVRMPRYQDSGRPRGYAHLDFKKPEGVAKALTLNGVTMMGRYLSVQRANEPRQGPGGAGAMPATAKPPGCKTVFVKNLPYDVTEEVVKEAFRFCGKIATVRLAVWQHTQHQKGFCYVEFEQESAAEIAVKKQGEITVGGRRVYVDYETGRPKGSFRTSEGRLWTKAQQRRK